MLPSAQDQYRTRLIVCHSCAEVQKRERDLAEDKHTDPGLQVIVEHI